MGIDIIVLALIVLALFKGLKKGLVLAVFSFLAFVVGLAAALKLSAVVAAYLGSSTNVSARWLPVLAFALVFVGVLLLVRLGAKLIEGALNVVLLGWANKLGGVLFYALLYGFVFSILLFWADGLHLLRDDLKKSSVTWPVLQPLAPKIIGGLGAVLPFFRHLFDELSAFFGGVAQKAS
ncbi:CvpA family protein [Flaviaesturariibacter aridisoli]|uniref:CvpA family protein n=1 Tax=Flaviaesturariibacter aridisoli TaxID=2545761 RepID=A0A4R4E442_9BACT|nr:CvpA family protein [Flaviaesturariibacter aridisoli]TCZ72751.1 CvpA family protein [Flaviaesturariibacter aridisoli]